jgi:hypothetical protein
VTFLRGLFSAWVPALCLAAAPLALAQKSGGQPGVPKDTVDLRDIDQKTLKIPEKLLFDIIWGGWTFKWVHAGQATLELLPTPNAKVWEIRSRAWGNKFFQSFYPVRDTVSSFINANGIYPLKFTKILHEGGYHARQWTDYDQANRRVKTQDTAFAVDAFSHDVLSAFYYIRTQDLKPGKSFELSAVSGKKNYKLKVICHREETVEVEAGKFQTWVVEPILKEDGLFKAKGQLWIWITRDARRLPVKMQSKIPVGSIKAELVKIGG